MRLLIGSLFCHSVSLLTPDNADMCEPEPITNPRPGSAIRPRWSHNMFVKLSVVRLCFLLMLWRYGIQNRHRLTRTVDKPEEWVCCPESLIQQINVVFYVCWSMKYSERPETEWDPKRWRSRDLANLDQTDWRRKISTLWKLSLSKFFFTKIYW